MRRLSLKKSIALGICCALISSGAVMAMPKDSLMDKVMKPSKGIGIQVNDQWLQTDVEPFIENNSTLIPLRGVLEKLGAKVEWHPEQKLVVISAEDIRIELIVGKDTVKVIRNINGIQKEEMLKLDTPAKMSKNRTFIPGRFVAQTLGAKVEWNKNLRAMIIHMNKKEDIIHVEKSIKFEAVEREDLEDNAVLEKWYQNNYDKEGFHFISDKQWQYVLIAAGEKPTGGYSITVDSITEVTPGTAYVHATLHAPGRDVMVTQALTYPNAIVRFHKGNIEKVQGDLSSVKQDNDESDKKVVQDLVLEFGSKLQMVSLLAPEDVVKKSMEENYKPFVSSSLLTKWQKDIESAPGRLTSSPYPDCIEILSVEKLSNDSYEVKGEILEVTSMDKLSGGFTSKQPITLIVKNISNTWLIDEVTLEKYNEADSIIYKNTQYGFSFSFPDTWEGYKIVTDRWEGLSLKGSKAGKKVEEGPVLSIRHPQWTDKTPRQDIPIMIFTLDQWNSLQKEKFSVGAAPILPKELGRNEKYVFALPARYNFSFLTGYEEVESILDNNAFQIIK
ncbi:stalk domain-containing protein [Defluviitalea saccharophila]|uniref:Stalk domain-containing protein n=1 Tax=Defluviitalea saccharophila TaxID=879970 RepID=A0ABZ2Y6U0_9FIRM